MKLECGSLIIRPILDPLDELDEALETKLSFRLKEMAGLKSAFNVYIYLFFTYW